MEKTRQMPAMDAGPRAYNSAQLIADDSTMPPRFFCPMPLTAGATIELPAEVAHHADRVLRLKAGETVTLFNGEGGEFPAELVSLGKKAHATLGERQSTERESPLEVSLAQSLVSSDKMDWVLQKAVELGVSRIQPVASTRSVVKLSTERAEKRMEHWRQVVISACEQCGRNTLPQLEPLQSLPRHLATPGNALRLFLSPWASERIHDLARPARVELLVGPEGGFTDEEEQAARAAGFRPVSLGPRVLRTETAGLAALSALQTLWGDF